MLLYMNLNIDVSIELNLLSRRREHLHARALQIRAERSTHIHRETGPQRPTHSFWSFLFNKTKLECGKKLSAFRQRQAHNAVRHAARSRLARSATGHTARTRVHKNVHVSIEVYLYQYVYQSLSLHRAARFACCLSQCCFLY